MTTRCPAPGLRCRRAPCCPSAAPSWRWRRRADRGRGDPARPGRARIHHRPHLRLPDRGLRLDRAPAQRRPPEGTHSLLGLALLTIAALWAGSWQRAPRPTSITGPVVAPGSGRAHHGPAVLGLTRALYIGGHHGDLFGIALAALVLWKGWDLVEVTPWHVPVLAVSARPRRARPPGRDMLTHDGCPCCTRSAATSSACCPNSVRITTNKARRALGHLPLLLALRWPTSSTATPPPRPDHGRVWGLALRQIGGVRPKPAARPRPYR